MLPEAARIVKLVNPQTGGAAIAWGHVHKRVRPSLVALGSQAERLPLFGVVVNDHRCLLLVDDPAQPGHGGPDRGRRQKTPVVRTEKGRNATTGQAYPWLVRSTATVNHFYFYAVDADFGPFFLKFASYFPYNAKLCLNGHEFVKRQLTQRGIPYE